MTDETNLSEQDKKVVQRSAAYPNITIQEALEIVSQIKKSFPTTQFDRDDVVAILKRTNITRDIGAAVQYGLLIKTQGQGYKLSDRVQSILNYVTDQERIDAITDCFKTPKLYLELIERFKGHALPGEQQFRAILIRYHGITESAASQAIEIFVSNAIYSGLLNENKILLGETRLVQEGNISKNNENNIAEDLIDKELLNNKSPKTLLLEEINGSVNLKIHLTEKKLAHLIYPENVNEKDIQILKLQLEALALTL